MLPPIRMLLLCYQIPKCVSTVKIPTKIEKMLMPSSTIMKNLDAAETCTRSRKK
jgi:hypothetical protein